MMTAWIMLGVSITVAIGVSFLCSLLESALLSLTPSQLAEIRNTSARRGGLCARLKKDIDNSLAVILICNTAAHTIGAAVAGAAFSELYGQAWLGIFTLVFTLVMVQYTEILPKTLGVGHNRAVMSAVAPALNFTVVILTPLIRLVHLVNRPFEGKKDQEPPTAAEEITALARMARSTQEIGSTQEHIIQAAPRLSAQTAAQIMLPRDHISFISTTQTPLEAINATHADFHTRYPVCDGGDRDKVVGYINFKELVAVYRANRDHAKLVDIVRPISFVDSDDTAANLLERFAVQHMHLAIVKDGRSGETLGLITLEDIVEELIGDLDDEFDPLPKTFYSPAEGLWVIGGGVLLSMVAMETPLALPKSQLTISDWFCRRIKGQPRVGGTLKFRNVEFHVRKIRRGRVMEFNVRRVGI